MATSTTMASRRLPLLILLIVLVNNFAKSVEAVSCPENTLPSNRHLVCYTDTATKEHPDICKCSLLIHLDAAQLQITRQQPPRIEKLRDWLPERALGRRQVVRITAAKGLSTATDGEIAKAIAEFVRDEKLDGVELAIEASSKNALLSLIKKIRSALSSSALLIVAVPGTPVIIAKHLPLKELSSFVDLFTLETYFLPSPDSLRQHPARLVASAGNADPYTADAVVDFVLSQNVPANQLILSIPAYGWRFDNNNFQQPKRLQRHELCEKILSGKYKIERDDDMTAPRAIHGQEMLAYDDNESVVIKTKYALTRELAGLSLFTLDTDERCNNNENGTSLIGSIHNTLMELVRRSRGVILASLEAQIPREEEHLPCSRQGYFAHPKSCNRFYRCVKFNQYRDEWTIFQHDCPAGLAFDERWEVCVWPGSLPNGAPCSGSSEIAPVPRQRFECPTVEGYYADPENCRWFFACLDHARDGHTPLTAYEFRCPFGLVFDPEHLACEWPWKVAGCGAGGVRVLYSVSAYATANNGGRYLAAYGGYPDTLISGGRSYGHNQGVILEQNVLYGLNTDHEKASSLFINEENQYTKQHSSPIGIEKSGVVGYTSSLPVTVTLQQQQQQQQEAILLKEAEILQQQPINKINVVPTIVHQQPVHKQFIETITARPVYVQQNQQNHQSIIQSAVLPIATSAEYYSGSNILQKQSEINYGNPDTTIHLQSVNQLNVNEQKKQQVLIQPQQKSYQQTIIQQPNIQSVIVEQPKIKIQPFISTGNLHQRTEVEHPKIQSLFVQQPIAKIQPVAYQQTLKGQQSVVVQQPSVNVQPIAYQQTLVGQPKIQSVVVQQPSVNVQPIAYQQTLLEQPKIQSVVVQQPSVKVQPIAYQQTLLEQPKIQSVVVHQPSVKVQPVAYQQTLVEQPKIQSVVVQQPSVKVQPVAYQQTLVEQPKIQSVVVQQPSVKVQPVTYQQTLVEQPKIQSVVVQQSSVKIQPVAYQQTLIEQPKIQSVFVQQPRVKVQPVTYQQTLVEQPKIQSVVVQQPRVKVQPVTYQQTLVEQPKIQSVVASQPSVNIQPVAYQQTLIEQPKIQPVVVQQPTVTYQQTLIEQPKIQPVTVQQPTVKIQPIIPKVEIQQPLTYQQKVFEQPKIQSVVVQQPSVKVQPITYQQTLIEQQKIQPVVVPQPSVKIQPVAYQQTLIEQPKIQPVVVQQPTVKVQPNIPKVELQQSPVAYQQTLIEQPKIQSVVVQQPIVKVQPQIKVQQLPYQETFIEKQNINLQPIAYQQQIVQQPKIHPVAVEQAQIQPLRYQETLIEQPKIKEQPFTYQQTLIEQPKISPIIVEEPRVNIQPVTSKVHIQPIVYEQQKIQPLVLDQSKLKVTPNIQIYHEQQSRVQIQEPIIYQKPQVIVKQPQVKVQTVTPKIPVRPVIYQQHSTVFEQKPQLPSLYAEQPKVKIQTVTPRINVLEQPIVYPEVRKQTVVIEQQPITYQQPTIKIKTVTPRIQPIAIVDQPKLQQVIFEQQQQPILKIKQQRTQIQQPIIYEHQQPRIKIQQVTTPQPKLIVSERPLVTYKQNPLIPVVKTTRIINQQQPKILVEDVIKTPVQQFHTQTLFQPHVVESKTIPLEEKTPVVFQQQRFIEQVTPSVVIRKRPVVVQSTKRPYIENTPTVNILRQRPFVIQSTVRPYIEQAPPSVVVRKRPIFVQQKTEIPFIEKTPVVSVIRQRPVVVESTQIPIVEEQQPFEQFHRQTFFEAAKIVKETPRVTVAPSVYVTTTKTRVIDTPIVYSTTTALPVVQVKRVRVRPTTPCPNGEQFHKLTKFEPINQPLIVSSTTPSVTSTTETKAPVHSSTIAVDDSDVKIILNKYATDLGRLGDKDAFISDVIAGHNEKIYSSSTTTTTTPKTTKKVVLVSNLADRHPLLISKLGAQCTCEPDARLKVRGRGGKTRKGGRLTTTTTPIPDSYDEENDDDNINYEDVVEIGNPRELKKRPIGVIYASSTTIAPKPSSVGRLNKNNDEIEYSSKNINPFLIRVTDDSNNNNYNNNNNQSPTKIVRRPNDNARIRSGKDSGEIPVERYGPGGRRGFKETLQGTIDCQRPGLFRHPKHCDKFYACHWDEAKGRYTLHVFNCPVHLAYDEKIGACNWPSAGPGCAQDNLLV